MDSVTPLQSSEPSARAALPALQALIAAPAVGGMVLLLVAVGLAAIAVGAYSGLAGTNGVTRHRRNP